MNNNVKSNSEGNNTSFKLTNGSRIAVIGGGPAGSFFSYFLLDLAQRSDINLHLDIYDPKDFMKFGPAGCNHCGGIISESLLQIMYLEGITIPSKVLQKGIDSYVLHMEAGSTKIKAPNNEKRIAAVFRGAGPLGSVETNCGSFDKFLLELAVQKGARYVPERVTDITFEAGIPSVKTRKGSYEKYDLIAGGAGLTSSSLKIFESMGVEYKAPKTTKTYISEFLIGEDDVQKYFGSSMHVFLLNIPRLDFAALIPKGKYVTLVLLGRKIDKELVARFMESPEVKQCFPPAWSMHDGIPCQCFPHINIERARNSFADRVVMLGDSATSKLYKNGIGAAYITSKAAASTAVLHGVSREDFRKHYMPACRTIAHDNTIGKVIFFFTRILQKIHFAKRGIIRMVIKEQLRVDNNQPMSYVLWDTFTGSAPYRSIFMRAMKPGFIIPLIRETLLGFIHGKSKDSFRTDTGETSDLGKLYKSGDIIVKEGDVGDCMYVIQSGTVEVIHEKDGKEVFLAELSEKDFFGEMALFEHEVRSATVRAKEDANVLTVDKTTLLRRIQDDPSMAFRILDKMSSRIRGISTKISRIKSSDRRNWDARKDKRDDCN